MLSVRHLCRRAFAFCQVDRRWISSSSSALAMASGSSSGTGDRPSLRDMLEVNFLTVAQASPGSIAEPNERSLCSFPPLFIFPSMVRRAQIGRNSTTGLLAHLLPMAVFLLFPGTTSFFRQAHGSIWVTAPEFWIYPLQTVVCAALLFFYRRQYDFHSLRQPWIIFAAGLFVFLLWIAPQQFFHFPPRRTGFDPEILSGSPLVYWSSLTLRFLRLVVVVPLLEEIFWRSFLLRFLISENFKAIPFGCFSWRSFAVVTVTFAFSHGPCLPVRFTISWLTGRRACFRAF